MRAPDYTTRFEDTEEWQAKQDYFVEMYAPEYGDDPDRLAQVVYEEMQAWRGWAEPMWRDGFTLPLPNPWGEPTS